MWIRACIVQSAHEDAAALRGRLDVVELDPWGAWYGPETRARAEPVADILVYHACAGEAGRVQDRVVVVPWTCPACRETLTEEMAQRVESLQQPLP